MRRLRWYPDLRIVAVRPCLPTNGSGVRAAPRLQWRDRAGIGPASRAQTRSWQFPRAGGRSWFWESARGAREDSHVVLGRCRAFDERLRRRDAILGARRRACAAHRHADAVVCGRRLRDRCGSAACRRVGVHERAVRAWRRAGRKFCRDRCGANRRAAPRCRDGDPGAARADGAAAACRHTHRLRAGRLAARYFSRHSYRGPHHGAHRAGERARCAPAAGDRRTARIGTRRSPAQRVRRRASAADLDRRSDVLHLHAPAARGCAQRGDGACASVRAIQRGGARAAAARRRRCRKRSPIAARRAAMDFAARGAAASRVFSKRSGHIGTSGAALQRRTALAHRPLASAVEVGVVRAILAAVDTGNSKRPIDPELAEFEALASASGAEIVARAVQRRARVDASTLVGSGKAAEIADLAQQARAELLLVLNDLRPRQRKNLEKIVPCPIVDRTMLILDVFARHARSREGKLQVELAQLRYRQSNLIGAGADLSRLGGGIGTRGPGETKLEVDRRRIAQRISVLERQLEEVRRQRATRRAARGGDPFVALVGYTNVGKSSLLNRLARANVLVADQPFATLDPTMRRVWLSGRRHVRLVDTVGFITDLPKDLVNAFRATLEELNQADMLVHVVDASNPDWPRQMEAVDATLHDLHLDGKPRLVAFNKIDAVDGAPPRLPHALYVSAKAGSGIAELRETLASLTGQHTSGAAPGGANEGGSQ